MPSFEESLLIWLTQCKFCKKKQNDQGRLLCVLIAQNVWQERGLPCFLRIWTLLEQIVVIVVNLIQNHHGHKDEEEEKTSVSRFLVLHHGFEITHSLRFSCCLTHLLKTTTEP